MIIRYKKCEISDLAELIDIAKSTFITAFKEANNPKDFASYIASAFSEKQMKYELLDSNSTFYFAYLNKNLVGYFKLNEKEAQHEKFNAITIELERIYILESFQRRQLGEKVLFKAVEIAKLKNVDFLWLGVWEKNLAAIRFYERHRFRKFETHSYYIGNDEQTDWLLKYDIE